MMSSMFLAMTKVSFGVSAMAGVPRTTRPARATQESSLRTCLSLSLFHSSASLREALRPKLCPESRSHGNAVVFAALARAPAEVLEHASRRVVAGRAADAAAGMAAGAAEIEAGDRRAIACRPDVRPQAEQLVQIVPAVKDIALGQAEHAFEIERCQDLASDRDTRQVGDVACDDGQDALRDLVTDPVPVGAVGEPVRIVLAQQAHDVMAGWRQDGVERGG